MVEVEEVDDATPVTGPATVEETTDDKASGDVASSKAAATEPASQGPFNLPYTLLFVLAGLFLRDYLAPKPKEGAAVANGGVPNARAAPSAVPDMSRRRATAGSSSEDEFAEFEEVYTADESAAGYSIDVTGGGGEKPVMVGMAVPASAARQAAAMEAGMGGAPRVLVQFCTS